MLRRSIGSAVIAIGVIVVVGVVVAVYGLILTALGEKPGPGLGTEE